MQLTLQHGKVILLILLINAGLPCHAQVNIIPNPSFEERNACPFWHWEFEKCNHWFNVSASNDYYHLCSNNHVILQMMSTVGGGEPPRTDSAMIGSAIFAWNYREYPGVKLVHPLQADNTYCLQLWVSLADGCSNCIQDFDVLLTSEIPLVNMPQYPALIYTTPQIKLAHGPLCNVHGWTKISGTYLAKGGEEYLTLGLFMLTDSVIRYPNHPLGGGGAYYLIDDVALYACNAPVEVADTGPDRHVCLGDSVQVGTHELAEYRYYWYIDSVLVSREARPVFSITQPTTYVLLVKDFKFDESWDTLILSPVNCDTIPLGCVQQEVYVCQGDSALLGCHNRDNYQYGWVQPPDTNTFSTSGQIWVKPESSTQYVLHTTDYTGRESLDTIRLTPVNCAMIRAHAGGHYRLCPGDTIALGASPIPGASYLWFQDLALIDTLPNPRVSPTTHTTYRLEVTNPRQETFTDWAYVEIVECDVPLLIPNAFTPNGDGLNDYFEIIAPEGTQLDVLIYSRWGNQLFSGNQDQFWDGSYHNVPVPLGTYYYSIKATLPPYRQTVVTGTVTVVK